MFLTIGTLLTLLAGAVIVTVAVIAFKKIREYLNRLRLRRAVTRFAALYKVGDVQHVSAGLFDQEANSVPEATVFKGSSIDSETQRLLPPEEIVLLDV